MQVIAWIVGFFMLVGPAATWAQSQQPHYEIIVGRDGFKITPEGAALCIALGVAPGAPCDGDIISERSQQSMDKSLWIQKLVSSLENPPTSNCLNPILIETYRERTFIHACHVPSENDTITEEDLQRVRDLATKLNADPNKTLAQHRWVMGLKNFWKYGPD